MEIRLVVKTFILNDEITKCTYVFLEKQCGVVHSPVNKSHDTFVACTPHSLINIKHKVNGYTKRTGEKFKYQSGLFSRLAKLDSCNF